MTETTAPPEAPFSVSWTPGKPPIITFRPDGDVTDWCPSLMEFRDSGIGDEIAKTQQALDAAFLVTTQLGGQRLPDRPAPAEGFTASPAVQGDGRSCPHGTMNFASGTSKQGKFYKRYDCPSKVQGCGPQWG